MRTLHTIGNLAPRATPLQRSTRRRRVLSLGDTNPDFTVPTGAPPGEGTGSYETGVQLLNQFDSYGATSEHAANPVVTAFQASYNADVASRGGTPLSVDGGYGPNTYTALDWILGGTAPAVNTGTSPGPSPPLAPVPALPPAPLVSPHPATPTAPGAGSGSSVGIWIVLAAVAGGAYFLFFRKKKRKAGGGGHSHALVEVRSNPRRRAARRR